MALPFAALPVYLSLPHPPACREKQMKFLPSLTITLFACTSVHAPLAAQGFTDRTYYSEELRADLELLRTTVHEAHADPYRYIGRTDLDRLFDRVRDNLNGSLELTTFMDSIEQVLRALGDGHTRCELPRDAHAAMERHSAIFPLEVAIIDSALYVRSERMGTHNIPSGTRIVSINGMPAATVLKALLGGMHADGRSVSAPIRTVERDFAWLYALRYGTRAEHDLVCENEHGVLERIAVRALTGEEIATAVPDRPSLLPWRTTYHGDHSLAWVEMTTLDAQVLASADQRPERFLGDLLRDLENKEVSTLVLDLRGADGPDLGMAEQVFALVARKPFRVVQLMAVRSVTVPTWYRRAVPLDDFYASAGGRFAAEETGLFVLPPSDERMKELPAAHRRFEGTVYVLQDGLTQEAGAAVGILVKRSGRGMLLGEEGGTNALSFCGGRELRITAPNTGVQFTVPLIRYLFEGALTGLPDTGEQPDVRVVPSAHGLTTGEDTVRSQVLSIIDALR